MMGCMEAADDLLVTGPDSSQFTFLFAHGAGVAMDAPFMQAIAVGLADAGIRVVRFEFPYMADKRRTGGRRPPDRPGVLLDCWYQVIAGCGSPGELVIGGKSMGGRIASLVADEAGVQGLVCLGYPFHPAGRPEMLRTEHLATLRTPTLILQGERDPFGTRQEVAGYRMSPAITVEFLLDGDHSFKPRVSSGRTEEQNLSEAVARIVAFMGRLG
jgi:uncharacterized protein